jgi:hypothetical protein
VGKELVMLVKKIINGVETEVEEKDEVDPELWLTGDDDLKDDLKDDDLKDDDLKDDDLKDDDLKDNDLKDDDLKDEGPEDDKKVSVRKHIQMKQKLKRRASEKEEEAEKLRQENEELKRKLRDTAPDVTTKKLVRPVEDDFKTTEEFNSAIEKYEQDLVDQRLALAERDKNFKAKKEAYIKQRDEAVDMHYDRAAKLIDESKIDPDVYKSVEDRVYTAVEEILPKMGMAIVDHFIALMGEGSEKVLYYVGRNKKIFDEFKESLQSDKTGLKTSFFLGKVLEKVNGVKNKKSNAKIPAKDLNGDVNSSRGEVLMLKKYQEAHKKGDTQSAFNIKRQARLKGFNVREWAEK